MMTSVVVAPTLGTGQLTRALVVTFLVTDTTFGKLSFPTKRFKKTKILNKIFTHDKTHFIDCVVVITVISNCPIGESLKFY